MPNRNSADSETELLKAEIVRLKKVTAALMNRVERSTSGQGNAFSLFEENILLARKVNARTTEVNREKEKLASIMHALPGKIIIFDEALMVVECYEGTSTGFQVRVGQPLLSQFGSRLGSKIRAGSSVFRFADNLNGQPRHFACTRAPLDDRLSVLYLYENSEQLRREAVIVEREAQILQTSKLASLGQMAGGIAHEINSPLAAIQLWSELISSGLKSGALSTEKALEALGKITTTTGKIASIIQGLRTFSRDASTDPVVPAKVSEVIEHTLNLCQEHFRSCKVDLAVTTASPNLTVPCREVQIQQILLNLLNNSFDAVNDLPDRWIRISVCQAANQVQIRVTDSGKGLPSEVRQKLFQPFFTTKPIGSGTGLGLSVAKNLARSHGGDLALDESNQHTSFIISLPLAA